MKVVFLDRDGVINEEVGYLSSVHDLRLIPGAGEAIAMLNRCGFKVVVVTNQSGVARGFFEEVHVQAIHRELERILAVFGAKVAGWYYCPHHPTEGRSPYQMVCDCRKPGTGLVTKACEELGLNPEMSVVVGDTWRDMELAVNVGAVPVLVLTGHGAKTWNALLADQRQKIGYVAEDLLSAAHWVCGMPQALENSLQTHLCPRH
ncbi:MAG: HAD family hydrolase [Dissulfuribacterales bacterium]